MSDSTTEAKTTKSKVSIESLLQDRRSGASGSMPKASVTVCLVAGLADDLAQLEDEKSNMEAEARRDVLDDVPRMGDVPGSLADTDEIDAEILALQEQMAEASITLHFEGLPGGKYRELVAAWPNSSYTEDRERWVLFLGALCSACYRSATSDNEPVEVPFGQIWDALTNGEQDDIHAAVLTINSQRVELPFSSRRSGKTRK